MTDGTTRHNSLAPRQLRWIFFIQRSSLVSFATSQSFESTGDGCFCGRFDSKG